MSALRAVAVLAVVVAAAGGAWSLAQATADRAAEPASGPGVIAVPVEQRVLETAVVDRGTARYADAVTVPLLAAADGGLITWSAPEGGTVELGSVLAEVSGRPVFALPGATPMYRTLERGLAGRDVLQFQEAMVTLGIRDEAPTGRFDHHDEHAAAQLYLLAGYEPEARSVPTRAGRLADDWRALTGGSLECPEPCPADIAEIRDALAEIYGDGRARVPAGEVVFVDGLPRRVGSPATPTSVELTSQTMEAEVTMGGTQADALALGMAALVDLDGAVATAGEITAIRPGAGDAAGLWVVTVALDDALPELAGQVVRVRVPLESSGGPVLAVPLAALAARADGSTAVTVQEPGGATRQVAVDAGLVADGYVEVRPLDGDLGPDDYVVVGERGGSP